MEKFLTFIKGQPIEVVASNADIAIEKAKKIYEEKFSENKTKTE